MLALRREKIVFPHSAELPAAAERSKRLMHPEEAEQNPHKRNLWRFRKPKEYDGMGEGRFKKSGTTRGDDKEESEDGASGGEGEHDDSPDELEREMENETDVDVDVDEKGVSFRMKETRRPHLKMVRQRHKQEGHAGA